MTSHEKIKKLHPNCIEYQKKIVNHPNYKDIPGIYNNLMISDGLLLVKVNSDKKEKNGG